MTHRPYPSRDRARRQLLRHIAPESPREPTEFDLRMARHAMAVAECLKAAFRPYGEAAEQLAAPQLASH